MCAWWIIRLNTIFLDGKRVPTWWLSTL
jgi:hypothetical protein